MARIHTFTLEAYGHPNNRSTHQNTIELTKADHLTKNGDCIVGVRASRGLTELPVELKQVFMHDSGRGRIVLTVGDESVAIEGSGSSGLTLLDPRDMVVRRSGFLSDRTLMVHADKAAVDLPRRLANRLKNPEQKILVEISGWFV